MKVIHSVRDIRGNIIQKQPDAGVGQQRCMKCQCLCTSQVRPDGTRVMACSGCGAMYTSQPLDGPRPPPPGALPTRLPR